MAEFDPKNNRYIPRPDAIMHNGRYFVPTVYGEREGNTQWIETWEEFRKAGGMVANNEDRTEITLHLPAPYKFSCWFNDKKGR